MLEKIIEAALVSRVKSLGGMCEKFSSPSKRAVPDRLVSMPDGSIHYVECKAPGKKPTKAQAYDHAIRRRMGFKVSVIDNIDDAKNFTP